MANLITTLADQFSNSYVDVAYADDFWTKHYNQTSAAQWLALTNDQKITLLIKACRVIETARFVEQSIHSGTPYPHYNRLSRQFEFINNYRNPIRYYYYQSLQFPRNLDIDLTTGAAFIPEAIKMAQCEQAVYSLNFDDSAIANRLQGITTDQAYVGSIRTKQVYVGDGSEWSPSALEYVKPYLSKATKKMWRA